MKYTETYIGDFETSTGNKDGSTNVYLWGFSNLDKTERFSGVNLGELLSSIEFWKIKHLGFHNLKFDGQFIIHHLVKEGYTFENNMFNKPTKEKTFTWMKDDMGVNYYLGVNINGHVVEFFDTARLMNSSVKALGEGLGYIQKGEIDYDKYKHFDKISDVPSELLDYLWTDIDIVIDAYIIFRNTYKNHGVTASGTAMKSFKKSYGRKDFMRDFGGIYIDKNGNREVRNVIDVETWDELKKGYRGGLVVMQEHLRNQTITMSKIYGYGESADANSLYPSVMLKGVFPVGKPSKKPIYGTNIVKFHKIRIDKAVIKDKRMPGIIPSNYKKGADEVRYLQEVYLEYYNLWDIELDLWEEIYDMEYEIIDTWYWNAEYVFKTWVNEMKHLKENATNESERAYHKLIMNGLYGKTAQNRKRKHRVLIEDPFHTEPGVRYGDVYVEAKEVSEQELLSPIQLGSRVTAYARCELVKAINANIDGFLYADTDSVYSSKPIVGIEMDDNKLGYWKPEKRYTKMKFVKPKAYIVQLIGEYKKGKWVDKDKVSVTCAGLSKENHSRLNFDNFEKGYVVENGKMMQRNVDGGVILVDVNYTV